MTNRERILTKPKEVQVVLRAMITRKSLEDAAPDYEYYAGYALKEWQELVEASGISSAEDEAIIAAGVVMELRKQEVWGKILREGTQ